MRKHLLYAIFVILLTYSVSNYCYYGDFSPVAMAWADGGSTTSSSSIVSTLSSIWSTISSLFGGGTAPDGSIDHGNETNLERNLLCGDKRTDYFKAVQKMNANGQVYYDYVYVGTFERSCGRVIQDYYGDYTYTVDVTDGEIYVSPGTKCTPMPFFGSCKPKKKNCSDYNYTCR